MGNTENDFWSEIENNLLPGEVVIYEGRPDVDKLTRLKRASLWILILLMPYLLPFVWWGTRKSAERHRFTITNLRVIITHGLIGYRTSSVPMERITDVTIGCSWLERWVGIRSAAIRDSAGGVQAVGMGTSIQGLSNPEEVQSIILNRVRDVNAFITGQESKQLEAASDSVLRATPTDLGQQISEALGLLRRIESHLNPQNSE